MGFLFAASIYLANVNSNLKMSIQDFSAKNETELKKLIEDERKKVKDDVEELHRSDMVSYQAMAKRLEIEKSKAREMQEKLKELEKKAESNKNKKTKIIRTQ